MAQRISGYKRKANDLYETPEWVTNALLPYLPLRVNRIWEPAAGSGKMVNVLREWRPKVIATDIRQDFEETLGWDFFDFTINDIPAQKCNAIITNPPFSHAQQFIEHSLKLMKPNQGVVALLLNADFDSAKTRRHLFGDCPQFSRKVILTKRIVWFEQVGKKAAPSANHSWYIWNYDHQGLPTISYWYENLTPDPCYGIISNKWGKNNEQTYQS